MPGGTREKSWDRTALGRVAVGGGWESSRGRGTPALLLLGMQGLRAGSTFRLAPLLLVLLVPREATAREIAAPQ